MAGAQKHVGGILAPHPPSAPRLRALVEPSPVEPANPAAPMLAACTTFARAPCSRIFCAPLPPTGGAATFSFLTGFVAPPQHLQGQKVFTPLAVIVGDD